MVWSPLLEGRSRLEKHSFLPGGAWGLLLQSLANCTPEPLEEGPRPDCLNDGIDLQENQKIRKSESLPQAGPLLAGV